VYIERRGVRRRVEGLGKRERERGGIVEVIETASVH
jgi:hypothetical protein